MGWLADGFGPSYFEQRRSGENAMPSALFRDRQPYKAAEGVPFHGFVHAWNGIFRVPATMWPANMNTPTQNDLLWVFDGLTVYWNSVLNARSGIAGKGGELASWGSLAANFAMRPGMQWRTLRDASNELIIQHGNSNIWPDGRRQPWPDWQLGTSDAYVQGVR